MEETQSQGCGKDIDLKAIESEMKGLDKPIKKEEERTGAILLKDERSSGVVVKEEKPNIVDKDEKSPSVKDTQPRIVSLVVPASLTMLDKRHSDVLVKRMGSESPLKKVEIQVKSVMAHEVGNKHLLSQKRDSNKGFDIYEFKEPEPFELGEMRRKDNKAKGSGSTTGEDSDQEITKSTRKRRPKKEGKDDSDRSESDSDTSLTPVKKQVIASAKEPIKETPNKRTAGETLEGKIGEVTPEKIRLEMLQSPIVTPKKTPQNKKDSLKSSEVQSESPKSPQCPKSADKESLRVAMSPVRAKSSDRQIIGVTGSTQIRALSSSPRSQGPAILRAQSPVSPQQTPVRYQGPITYSGPGTLQGSVTYPSQSSIPSPVTYSGPGSMTYPGSDNAQSPNVKPVALRTKNPNPVTYPGSAVHRNLASSLGSSMTVGNTGSQINVCQIALKSQQQASSVNNTTVIPQFSPNTQTSHLPTNTIVSQAASTQSITLNQPRATTIQHNNSTITISTTAKSSSSNTTVPCFSSKPKLTLQPVPTNRASQSVTLRPSLSSNASPTVISPLNNSNLQIPVPSGNSQISLSSDTSSSNTVSPNICTINPKQLSPGANTNQLIVSSSTVPNIMKIKAMPTQDSSVITSQTNNSTPSATQANPVIHLLAQVVMPPKESKALAKPISKLNSDKHLEKTTSTTSTSIVSTVVASTTSTIITTSTKSEDKNDPKVIPFSQRQQHIFPHLLNRPEPGDKYKETTIKSVSTSTSYVSPCPPSTSDDSSSSQDVSKSQSMSDTSAESQDTSSKNTEVSTQTTTSKNKSESSNSNDISENSKTENKPPDKRRRSSNRIKKVLSREFIPDTSEESDSDNSKQSQDIDKKGNKNNTEEDNGNVNKISRKSRTSEMEKNIARRKSCDDNTTSEDERKCASSDSKLSNSKEKDSINTRTSESLSESESIANISSKRESEISEKEARLPRKKLRSCVTPKRLEDEVETGLGDLLCEETIPPGSPMAQETNTGDSDTSSRADIKHEMPFASVPTGSSFGKRGSNSNASSEQHIVGQCHQIKSSISHQHLNEQYNLADSSNTLSNNSKKTTNIETSTSKSCNSSSTMNTTASSQQRKESNISQVINSQVGNSDDMKSLHQSASQQDNVPSANNGGARLIDQSSAVIDNTPPTTPESILSNLSDSPRRDQQDLSKLDDTSKSGRDSELDSLADHSSSKIMDHFSEDSNTMDSNLGGGSSGGDNHQPTRGRGRPSNSSKKQQQILMQQQQQNQQQESDMDAEEGGSGNNNPSSAKKRKRGPRARAIHDDDDEISLKKNHNPSSSSSCAAPGRRKRTHSSSKAKDEDLDNSGLSALSTAACAAGRSKYNFIPDLDPDLDAEKRIARLQNCIQELKKTYMHVKSELASVERRRKKLRKRERESKYRNII